MSDLGNFPFPSIQGGVDRLEQRGGGSTSLGDPVVLQTCPGTEPGLQSGTDLETCTEGPATAQ